MIKLLKYEFLQSFMPFAIMCGAFAMSFVLMIVFHDKIFFLFGVGVFGAIIALFGLFIVWAIFVIRSFWKNLFGTYGTLIFSLPLSIDSILLAKILNGFILTIVSGLFYVFVAIISLKYAYDYDSIQRLLQDLALARLYSGDVFTIVSIIAYQILSCMESLTKVLFTMAVLNSMHIQDYRFIIGLLLYIALSFVPLFIIFIFSFIIGEFGALIAGYPIAITIFYFWARYLIVRKLELL